MIVFSPRLQDHFFEVLIIDIYLLIVTFMSSVTLAPDTEAEEAELGVVVLQEAQSATAIAVIAAADLL